MSDAEKLLCARAALLYVVELLDGTFTPLPEGGDEGDRTFVEAAYNAAVEALEETKGQDR